MGSNFSSEFFKGNRERLKQLFSGTAPIIVTANGLLQKGSDETFPFHQDRSFWYLTGIDEPNALLVLDKSKELLIIPKKDTAKETFDGASDFAEIERISGISDILDDKKGWKRLESRLKKVNHVATLAAAPRFVDLWGMYTNPARAELIQRIKSINDDAELLDLREHLARLRVVKQDVELTAIQSAIDTTVDTLKEVIRPSKLTKYAYEYEVEADISKGFRRRGATGHAFSPVVASGKRACTLHYIANNGALASDELLVMDVGVEYDHYAADITRTVSLSSPSNRQQAVYDAVLDVQEFGLSQLKPGVSFAECEKQLRAYMGEKLRELGLIKTIDEEAVRKYYPHAPHYMGLDVHDVGDYHAPLEPGMVLTVEPGIYIPEEDIGVRIEDDVLITTDGIKVLTSNLPRALA
ncbi:MAG TPA: Xaa-Pro aminopeptidase [Candidatus Saccharimonadales bacterium]|nr:Xaa-Pro aminopeptidase [Candidatus Saccharimonadales bacterium]